MSFCIRLLFYPWLQIHLYYPHHLCYPLLILPSSSTTLVLAITEVVPTATGAQIATGATVMTSLIFMALIPLLPWTGSRVISSTPNSLLLVGNGLLIGPLSRTSSVSYQGPSWDYLMGRPK
jgi:hypothetical protein